MLFRQFNVTNIAFLLDVFTYITVNMKRVLALCLKYMGIQEEEAKRERCLLPLLPLFNMHTHPSSGKPFSAIPLLTTTTGLLTNSLNPYRHPSNPDRQELQASQTGQSSSACAAVPGPTPHCSTPMDKLTESHSEIEFDGEEMGKPLTSSYPSDAKFPGKHGLFFADCLSNKYKDHHKNNHWLQDYYSKPSCLEIIPCYVPFLCVCEM